MALALTNEERFIASCVSAGEADVRQKLGAGRYAGRKAEWASGWLEQVESGKGEAISAAESSGGTAGPATSASRIVLWAILPVVLIVAAVAYLFLK